MPRRHVQTILAPPHGNALQAAVATVLDAGSLDDVPNFVAAPDGDYWGAMQEHARSVGLGLVKVPLQPDGRLAFPGPAGALCVARGASPRGDHGHVVVACVARDGLTLDLVHDPHPDGGGLAGPASWTCFYVAAEPAATAAAVRPLAKTAAATVDAITARLAPALRSEGFDLLAPFAAGWYNEEPHIAPLGDQHKLDAAAGALAFIVGNSRALWPPFVRHVRAALDEEAGWLDAHPDALDEYTRLVVRRALACPGLPAARVVYAYETLETYGRAVSVTTAAHVAGLAYYHQPLKRSVHPVLGPWVAYRAIIIFDGVDVSGMPPPPPPADPCSPEEWERAGTLQARCFELWQGEEGSDDDWARLVEIVKSFTTGAAQAYSDEHLRFHYQQVEARRVAHLKACALDTRV